MLGSVECSGLVGVDGPSELSSGGYIGFCCARSSRRQSRRYFVHGAWVTSTGQMVEMSDVLHREADGD